MIGSTASTTGAGNLGKKTAEAASDKERGRGEETGETDTTV